MDKDGDGKVSREEFTGPKPRFDLLDRNGDGFVTQQEFLAGAQAKAAAKARRREEEGARSSRRPTEHLAEPSPPRRRIRPPRRARRTRSGSSRPGSGRPSCGRCGGSRPAAAAPALIIPPPKRMRSGSIVCISETAPTARYRAVSRIRRSASASPAAAASAIVRLVMASAPDRAAGSARQSRFEGLVGSLDQRRRRGIGLEVPRLAARALPPVVHLDDDMTALGTVAVPALVDQAVDHEPAADPGAQGEHHQALRALARRRSRTHHTPRRCRRSGARSACRAVRRAGRGSAGSPSPAGSAAREAMPAGMSIVPGEPSPTPAIRSQATPLASTARRPASAR